LIKRPRAQRLKISTRSSVVSFFDRDAVETSARLMRERVKVTGREAHGGHIRVSPHFYNTKKDIDHFIEKIREG
jgi:selenocysteine lyase/cysteine desulfurase